MVGRSRTVKLGHNVTLGIEKPEEKKNDTFFDETSTSTNSGIKSFAISGRGHSLFINGFNSKR